LAAAHGSDDGDDGDEGGRGGGGRGKEQIESDIARRSPEAILEGEEF